MGTVMQGIGHGGLAGGEVVDGKDRVQPVCFHGVSKPLSFALQPFPERGKLTGRQADLCHLFKIACLQGILSSESSRLKAITLQCSAVTAASVNFSRYWEGPLHIGTQQVAKAGQVNRYGVEFHRNPAQRDDP